MESSDLVKYLFSLDSEETTQFGLYLQSPFFTRKKLPLRLFEFLLPFHAEWLESRESPVISREAAFEALYPGEAFVPQRLRRVRMELQQLLLDFISLQAPSALPKPFSLEYGIRKHLLDKGLLDLYQKRTVNGVSLFHSEEFMPSHHLADFYLELLHNEYFIHAGKPEDSLELAAARLDRFFLSTRLELWTAMANKERIYNRKHDYAFEEVISAMIESEQASEWQNVQLWWNVFRLQQPDHGGQSYEYLVDFLPQKSEELPLRQLRQIRGFMLNFLNRSSEGHDKSLQLWQLLRSMLQEGTLYAQGKINSPLFRNTLRAACLSGNVAWAKAFLKDHGPFLKGEEAEVQLDLFAAMVLFYEKEPLLALRASELIRFKSARNELYLKVLQIMCAYEIGEEEAFFRRAEAFRKYVSNAERLGRKFADHYQAFARITLRLGRIRFQGQAMRPDFEQEVMEMDTAEKAWLLRTVEELA